MNKIGADNSLNYSKLLPAFLISFTLAVSNYVFLFCIAPHFFDFTDEGYYLNLISDPYAFSGRITRFAEPIHWLYIITGKNLICLRQFSIILLFALCTCLSWLCVKRTKWLSRSIHPGKNFINVSRLLAAIVISNSAILGLWPTLTPSYNFINYVGMSLYVLVLLLSESWLGFKKQSSFSIIALGLLLSLPLVLVSYARLTSFILLLTFSTFIALFGTPSFRKLLFTSVLSSIAFYLLLAYLSFGGYANFFDDMRLSFEIVNTWKSEGSDFTFLSSIRRLLPNKVNLISFISAFALFILTTRCQAKIFHIIICITSCCSGILMALLWTGFNFSLFNFSHYCRTWTYYIGQFLLPFLFFYLILACLKICFTPLRLRSKHFLSSFFRFPCPNVVSISDRSKHLANSQVTNVLIFTLPFAFAFSSSNGFFSHASLTLLFVVLGFFRLCNSRSSSIPNLSFFVYKSCFLTLTLIPVFISTYLLSMYSECQFPYQSSTPLSEAKYETNISTNSKLYLSNTKSKYINSIKTTMVEEGYTQGQYVLDLTGNSPGLVYALGAKAVGWPWILDFFPGSTDAALKVLEGVPLHILNKSWIFINPNTQYLQTKTIADRFDFKLTSERPLIFDQFSPYLNSNILIYKPKDNNI